MLQNLQNVVKFQKFQLENLVDFERCCKTHIFLQKSESIQPKTSNICRNFANRRSLTASRPRQGRGRQASAFFENAFFENAFSKSAFFENFENFWRVRSRLYQNEILQENMRLTAFFKLYKICILLHRCNLKIFAKN